MEMYNHGLHFLNKSKIERTNNLITQGVNLDLIKNSINNNEDFESIDTLYALVNTSFGFSYLSVLDRLKERKKIIRLKDILKNPTNERDFMLKKTLEYMKDVKSKKERLSYIKTKMISDYLKNEIVFYK